jgi:hypothetical protein
MIRRVRIIAKSYYYLRQVCPSIRLSAWNISAPAGRICVKFDIWFFFFFGKSVQKLQVSLESDEKNGTLREDQYTFLLYLAQSSWNEKHFRRKLYTLYVQYCFWCRITSILSVYWGASTGKPDVTCNERNSRDVTALKESHTRCARI